MATHSRILAWRSPVDGGASWATVHGVTELDMTERLSTAHKYQLYILETDPLSVTSFANIFPHL